MLELIICLSVALGFFIDFNCKGKIRKIIIPCGFVAIVSGIILLASESIK